MKLLDKEFFSLDAEKVARKLLGKIIEFNGMKGIIVETEAYGRDKASHACRRTKRSELMYSSHGKIYVYLVYGMHYCLNFTADCKDAGAVLIRAVEPINFNADCKGPGKVCKFFDIDMKLNGAEIGNKLKVYDNAASFKIARAKRIGIAKGKDEGLLLRFYVADNKFVSRT